MYAAASCVSAKDKSVMSRDPSSSFLSSIHEGSTFRHLGWVTLFPVSLSSSRIQYGNMQRGSNLKMSKLWRFQKESQIDSLNQPTANNMYRLSQTHPNSSLAGFSSWISVTKNLSLWYDVSRTIISFASSEMVGSES